MNRVFLFTLLISALSAPMGAQRLDGCVVGNTSSRTSPPTGKALDETLRNAGIGLTSDVLAVGMRDPRPDVRALAAVKLAHENNRGDAKLLLEAWQQEADPCTKGIMQAALSRLVGGLALDPAQHPRDQLWVKPFQKCVPSPSSPVSLTIEQDKSVQAPATVIVTARNETSQLLVFAWARDPQMLFSATVTGPADTNAKIAKAFEGVHEPPKQLFVFAHLPIGVVLMPHEGQTLHWTVGNEFDMSAPGTYHVSLGGWVPYLDTTVCSNVASVIVEK